MSTALRITKPIALTCGDPAGIGPDITLGAWLDRAEKQLPVFMYLGDAAHLRDRAAALSLELRIQPVSDPMEAVEVFPHAVPVLEMPLPCFVKAGQPDPRAASAITASIAEAVKLVLEGAASAIVTNPIAKHILHAAGFAHPGHTEFLGALAVQHGCPASPVMMLAGPDLRVVPVTIHVPLADVPLLLTGEKIAETVRITASGLRRWFGIAHPRIAVTGLNPHAGESGTIGSEEVRVIEPAIAALREAGLNVTGPHPADALFHERARKAYDVAIAMYHDQALIPLKTLAFDDGVNVTLGLPFIRTSPDHGTAFDIAATGKARPDSLIAALRLASIMTKADKLA